MVRTPDTSELKSRQKATAEKMTRAQRVHHQLLSGPVKSELRTVPETIQLAAAFNRQARKGLEDLGLDPDNGFALVIAYLTPDLSTIFTCRFVAGKEAEVHKALTAECCIMAGLIFGMQDPEHNGDWLYGAKPFLTTPLVLSALKERIQSDIVGIN